ncbi:MAG TPA: tetratricopeptide repeat protein [Candidatus Saccharimonadales bacterium]|nr:tetratricopeptide repeat protein [Candidatus Saccharimonadales bacterium]
MFWVRRWLVLVFALVLSGGQILVASTREERAFAAAASAFQDGMWSRAEVEFAEFAEKYPKSERVAEAMLLQAEADFKQQKYLEAIDLLTASESRAGKFADQYVYWLGEAQFQNENYAAAAAVFARLVQDFPDSHWRLDSVVNEAAARAKLDQWPQVSALLEKPDGVFQTEAKKNPAAEPVARGQLLLAEALLRQNKLSEAAAILRLLAAQKLTPELSWQQTQLFCRVQLASGDMDAALGSTTNLIRLADMTGQAKMRAASVAERGNVLERMGLTEEALAAYRENLATNVPPDWQRQAILEIAELAAAQKNFSEGEQSLEQFLNQFPGSPSADVAQLTLGELHLKQAVSSNPLDTNQLALAQMRFDQFIGAFTNSVLLGKAYLDKGWCDWCKWMAANDANSLTDSLTNFEAAAQLLLPSVDLAVARFKMGDALFAQKDYAGARDNYEAVANDFTNFPAVTKGISAQALYQMLRACLVLKDVEGASNALARILTSYPTSNLADRSILLVGEGLSDLQKPASARALFEKFEELFPDSPLRPEVELALARTYEQEDNWSAAIGIYDHWVKQYTNDTQLLPQVAYARAMANYQAGNETNALSLFTNFVAQFPTNGLAPIAQWWIGGYFYNTGTNYVDAERNYELLFQNWPNSSLADQAKLMAGRAAMGRLGYSDAIQYFTSLTSDSNCPPDVYVPALFAYGGALMLQPSTDTNDPLANFEQAIQVFKAICQSYPQSEQAALAWGEIGDCYLQLAGQPQGAHYYDDATNAYAQVISSPLADAAARSQAQLGIGRVLEKRAAQATGPGQTALLQQALQNYLDVFYGTNLRNGETADPFWVKKAGLQAASVAETLGEWPQAVNVYRRLEELLPPLRGLLEQKIANARIHITSGQN